MSVAYRVLQVAGLIETKNERLLKLRGELKWFVELINKPRSEWDAIDEGEFSKLLREACKRVVEEANAVFSTCIAATSIWAREFRDKVGLNIIDEAGAVTLLEAVLVWRGNTPIILVGDNNQLPPPVMTINQKFENGKPVNAFDKQLQQPLLHALIENNWPYWLLSEQMRIEPGLFDPANFIIYDNKISYHPSSVLSAEGEMFEKWCGVFARECSGIFRHTPEGSAYPLLISVKNAYTFSEARGTSRGNSHYVHYSIKALLSFLKHNPSIMRNFETILESKVPGASSNQ